MAEMIHAHYVESQLLVLQWCKKKFTTIGVFVRSLLRDEKQEGAGSAVAFCHRTPLCPI